MAEKPPNLRPVEMPDCCWVCEFLEEAAQSYPNECREYNYFYVDPSDICDSFKRKESNPGGNGGQ